MGNSSIMGSVLWTVFYMCYLLQDKGTTAQQCPAKCSQCKYDSNNQVTSTTCIDTRIQRLPNTLVDLTLKDTSIHSFVVPLGELRDFYFKDKTKLQTLTIDNYGIKGLKGSCFVNTPNLTTLTLTNNPLSQIEENNFHGLVNLLYLDLSYNHLVSLTDFTFRQLKALRELKILMNNLTSIGSNSLKGLDSVEKIDFLSNKITSIQQDAFSGLVTLRDINLRSNRITRIEAGTFSNLNNLVAINLQHNKLIFIDSDSIIGTPALNNINLVQNLLKTLPSHFLQKVSNIQLEVNLARNNLTILKDGDLAQVTLKTLYLVGNQISVVEAKALEDSYIQKFDLQQNLLRHLPQAIKHHINQSTVILLANNPWLCDCDIYWLPEILTNGTQEPVCAEPISYMGWNVSRFAKTVNMSCLSGSLPVPTKILPQPPKQGIITPALGTKTKPSVNSSEIEHTNTTNFIPTDKGEHSNIPIIVGGCVGGLLFLILCIVIIIYLYTKHAHSKVHSEYCDKMDFNNKSQFDKQCIQTLVQEN